MTKSKRARQLIALTELHEQTRTLDQEVASLYVASVDMENVNAIAETVNNAVQKAHGEAKTVEVVYAMTLLIANAIAHAEGMSPEFKVKICAGLGDAAGEMVAAWAIENLGKQAVTEESETPTPPARAAKKNGADKAPTNPTRPPARLVGPEPYTEKVNGSDHDVYLIDEFQGLNKNELPKGRAHAAIMERNGFYFMEPASFDLENLGELPPEATHVVWVQQ